MYGSKKTNSERICMYRMQFWTRMPKTKTIYIIFWYIKICFYFKHKTVHFLVNENRFGIKTQVQIYKCRFSNHRIMKQKSISYFYPIGEFPRLNYLLQQNWKRFFFTFVFYFKSCSKVTSGSALYWCLRKNVKYFLFFRLNVSLSL